ncbi:monofunctional biosynthetic peptidoglycan transglycosylase [Dongia sp.]|uniref:monofunctional biosynthetic peptidoglycan transglycosylase n=1 Tax=Dongia sp. TaxID=1977262 RepID=UPI0035AF2602
MSVAGNGRQPGLIRRLWRLFTRILGLFLLISVLLTAVYAWLPPPVTPLMLLRVLEGNWIHKDWEAYDNISPHLPRAIIAAEDAKFCQHRGFDWESIEKAWKRNQAGKRIRGGSTISNQTAKNVFLWPDRSYIRKGVEFYFTGLIELTWTKKRILEVYMNVVEFGPGIYGAEAAAEAHFGKTAKDLTRREAALLAAVLPNPIRWSASKPTSYIRSRAGTIQARMNDVPDPTGDPCVRAVPAE